MLNLLLQTYWEDQNNSFEDRQAIYSHFGTFTRALFSMFEVLYGNWYSITRMLADKVSETYILFGMLHQLVIGFAVINVITGVFLNETFKCASLDDSIMMNEMKRAAKAQTAKLSKFFEQADKD